MTALEISTYTNIGERRVHEILAHFQKTGGVDVPKCEKATRSRALHDEEIEVISISYTLGSSHSNLVFLPASIQDTQ